jgi:hypothetical protein
MGARLFGSKREKLGFAWIRVTQDARFPTFADLPETEFGNFPTMVA